jgi:hypothetical protein
LIPAGELVIVPLPVPPFVAVSAKVWGLNVAVTDFAAVIVTTQEPVPVHAPLQPANVEPAVAVGVSVTDVPLLKLAEQVAPQLMPAGELATLPLPAPAFASVRLKVCEVNVAVTDCAAFIVTAQVPVPVQGPLQPVKTDPAEGVAVSVTEVPAVNPAEQVEPQVIPTGALPTLPFPLPALTSVKVAPVVAHAVFVYEESPAVL